ncbi:MAG: hypothetical protein RL077_3693, partial [Verrucomicrobiota bacterium]
MKLGMQFLIGFLLGATLNLRSADAPQKVDADSVATESWPTFQAKLRDTMTRHLNQLLGADGSVRAMKGKTAEGNGALAFYLMFEITGEQRYRQAALSLADQVLKDMRATKFGVLPIKEKDK